METLKTELVRVADIETGDPALLRDILKAVIVVKEDPDITLDPEGIRIVSMSPDHVCMIDLLLTRGFFDAYDVVDEIRGSVQVTELIKLLFNRKTGKLKDSSLKINLKGDKLTFDGYGQLKGRKTFYFLDPYEETDYPTPKLTFDAKVRITTKALKRAIDDCTVDENLRLTVDPDNIQFYCDDGDYLEENNFDKYADEILYSHTDGTQKAYYPLISLNQFPKALAKISEAVDLEFSTDTPLKIAADLPYDSHLIYYIAPKIWTGEKHAEIDPHEEPEEIPAVDYDDGAPDNITEIPAADPHEEPAEIVDVDAALNNNDIDLDQVSACFGDYDPSSSNCTVYCDEAGSCELEAMRIEAIRDQYTEIPAVETVPDPYEDQPSLGELYLKYYAEARARFSAEAA